MPQDQVKHWHAAVLGHYTHLSVLDKLKQLSFLSRADTLHCMRCRERVMVCSCPDLLRLSICCQLVVLQGVQNGRDTPGVLIVPFQVMAWGCRHCVGKLDLGHAYVCPCPARPSRQH